MKNYKKIYKLVFGYPAAKPAENDNSLIDAGAYLLEAYCRQNCEISSCYSLSDCGVCCNDGLDMLAKRLNETVGAEQISQLLTETYLDHSGEYSLEDVAKSAAILHFMNKFEFPAFMNLAKKRELFLIEFPKLSFDIAADTLRDINSKIFELRQNEHSSFNVDDEPSM